MRAVLFGLEISPTRMDESDSDVKFYNKNGYLRMQLFSEEEISKMFAALGDDVFYNWENRHVDHPIAARIVRSEAMVDFVSKIFGRNLNLWRSTWFQQGYDIGAAFGFHRDSFDNFFPESCNKDFVSLHMALTPAFENNCVVVSPGTHKMDLARLEEVGLRLNPEGARSGNGNLHFTDLGFSYPEEKMVLKAGECFFFHPNLIHRSNMSFENEKNTRYACAMRVSPGYVKVNQKVSLLLGARNLTNSYVDWPRENKK